MTCQRASHGAIHEIPLDRFRKPADAASRISDEQQFRQIVPYTRKEHRREVAALAAEAERQGRPREAEDALEADEDDVEDEDETGEPASGEAQLVLHEDAECYGRGAARVA